MTELVRKYVVESLLIVDDFLSEFNGAVVSYLYARICGEGPGSDSYLLSTPICATGCCFECLGPDELDAACRLRELVDTA